MQQIFREAFDALNSDEIFLKGKIIQKYQFYFISKDNRDILQEKEIKDHFKQSNEIIINKYCECEDINPENCFIIISFEKTVISVEENSLTILQNFLNSKQNVSICFLNDIKKIFDQNIQIEYNETENNIEFKLEIASFNSNLKKQIKKGKSHLKVWNNIKSCISGYMIKESYHKLNHNRLDNFFIKQNDSLNPMN